MPPGTWNAGMRASASEASAVSVQSPSAVVRCMGPSHSHTCQGRWDLGSCSYREIYKKGDEQSWNFHIHLEALVHGREDFIETKA